MTMTEARPNIRTEVSRSTRANDVNLGAGVPPTIENAGSPVSYRVKRRITGITSPGMYGDTSLTTIETSRGMTKANRNLSTGERRRARDAVKGRVRKPRVAEKAMEKSVRDKLVSDASLKLVRLSEAIRYNTTTESHLDEIGKVLKGRRDDEDILEEAVIKHITKKTLPDPTGQRVAISRLELMGEEAARSQLQPAVELVMGKITPISNAQEVSADAAS